MSHAHAHAHGHHHHHHHAPPQGARPDRRYAIAIVLNLAFVVLEAGAGFWANSTSLLADAGHNLSDVLALALAGGAAWLAQKTSRGRRTYGFGKATILAALLNALLLVLACGAIGWEALRRFGEPQEIRTDAMMAVAAAGVVINLGTAFLFWRGRLDDVNVRGAFLHMAGDAAVSLGVVVAGLLIAVTGLVWIDTAASLLVVVLILIGTWGLLRESLDLAMDAAPESIELDEVHAFLKALPGVSGIHDVHVWNLSARETALTAHLVRAEPAGRGFYDAAIRGLHEAFDINHVTLQVETEAVEGCPEC
ncbi:MAG TPA: cation diffusion facilitator family transporter [Caulobacteraceae bacterium]|jgi:cobalt-zinc-cadmium efflux system protein